MTSLTYDCWIGKMSRYCCDLLTVISVAAVLFIIVYFTILIRIFVLFEFTKRSGVYSFYPKTLHFTV
jgi:hypothetical protein